MRYPMFKVHIPVDEAIEGIGGVLRSGFLNEGVQVRQFEKELEKFLKVNRLVLVNACTSALTIAYKLSGVEPGTSVVSTSMTCIATNTPISNLGGRIIWADIDRWSGNIDPQQIEAVIDEDTKAIVSVSWAGSPPDLEAIDNIAKSMASIISTMGHMHLMQSLMTDLYRITQILPAIHFKLSALNDW